MSYNNFYNNFHGSNFTFHIPPPPRPPPFLITPQPEVSDQDFIKQLELKILPDVKKKNKIEVPSISEVKEKLCKLIKFMNILKDEENELSKAIETLDDVSWNGKMKKIKGIQSSIDCILNEINNLQLDVLRKLIAKRVAKRLRLRKVNERKKKEKEQRIKELQERSRKIDENLQKIKDDITKQKQEEDAKLEADIVLKEVLRKKHDAKKCIVKLDAFMKLRKARQNTAKGRGEHVSESDQVAFNNNIEKLKTLWTRKLAQYEKEESELNEKLKKKTENQTQVKNEMEQQVSENLDKWKDVLFGGINPQVDFGGDFGRFIAIRSQWDQYIDSGGTPLPAGWVAPSYSKA